MALYLESKFENIFRVEIREHMINVTVGAEHGVEHGRRHAASDVRAVGARFALRSDNESHADLMLTGSEK